MDTDRDNGALAWQHHAVIASLRLLIHKLLVWCYRRLCPSTVKACWSLCSLYGITIMSGMSSGCSLFHWATYTRVCMYAYPQKWQSAYLLSLPVVSLRANGVIALSSRRKSFSKDARNLFHITNICPYYCYFKKLSKQVWGLCKD